jgi:hypothetical protein
VLSRSEENACGRTRADSMTRQYYTRIATSQMIVACRAALRIGSSSSSSSSRRESNLFGLCLATGVQNRHNTSPRMWLCYTATLPNSHSGVYSLQEMYVRMIHIMTSYKHTIARGIFYAIVTYVLITTHAG